jgi:hypothetical protein
MGEWIHIFLTSALVGSEWSTSRPDRFNTGERAPGTHWTGVWVGPRAGLDDVEKRKFLTLPGLELRPAVAQSVASRYTDCAIPPPSKHSTLAILPTCPDDEWGTILLGQAIFTFVENRTDIQYETRVTRRSFNTNVYLSCAGLSEHRDDIS